MSLNELKDELHRIGNATQSKDMTLIHHGQLLFTIPSGGNETNLISNNNSVGQYSRPLTSHSLPDVAKCTLQVDGSLNTIENALNPSDPVFSDRHTSLPTSQTPSDSITKSHEIEIQELIKQTSLLTSISQRIDRTEDRSKNCQQSRRCATSIPFKEVVSSSGTNSWNPNCPSSKNSVPSMTQSSTNPVYNSQLSSLLEVMLPVAHFSTGGSSSLTPRSSLTGTTATEFLPRINASPNGCTYPASLMPTFLSSTPALLSQSVWQTSQPSLLGGSFSNNSVLGQNKSFFQNHTHDRNSMSAGVAYSTAFNNSTNGFSSSSNTSKTSPDRTSSTNLYIKGLAAEFTDEKLKSLVPDANLVKSVKAASDDGCSCKGYGFIDFVTAEAALAAQKYIQQHYGSFTVKFAKENEKDTTNLYITNLPLSWKGKKDEERLKDEFTKYGLIQSVHIQTDPSTNRSTGVGFVRFTSEEGAKKALEDLRDNARYLDNSTVPLQAKFADKHNAARARRNSQQPVGSGVKTRLNSLPRPELLLSTVGNPSTISPYPSLLVRPTAFPFLTGNAQSAAYPQNLTTSNNLNTNASGTSHSVNNTSFTQLPTINTFLQPALLHDGVMTFNSLANLYAAASLQHLQQQQHLQHNSLSTNAAINPLIGTSLTAGATSNPTSALFGHYNYLSNVMGPQYFQCDYPQYYNANVSDQ